VNSDEQIQGLCADMLQILLPIVIFRQAETGCPPYKSN